MKEKGQDSSEILHKMLALIGKNIKRLNHKKFELNSEIHPIIYDYQLMDLTGIYFSVYVNCDAENIVNCILLENEYLDKYIESNKLDFKKSKEVEFTWGFAKIHAIEYIQNEFSYSIFFLKQKKILRISKL